MSGSEKGNTRKNKKGERKLAVLTAECNRAFEVSAEKSKKFLEHKNVNGANKKMLSKISKKIKDGNDKT